jgi:hypothetical protein
MRWIVDELEHGLSSDVVDRRLLRGPYPERLSVAPMIGVTGLTTEWDLEAPAIARDVAAAYEAGAPMPIASAAFFETRTSDGPPPPGVAEIRDKIKEYLDCPDGYVLALTTLRRYDPTERWRTALPQSEGVAVEGASAEVCSVFLCEDGAPALPKQSKGPVLETAVDFELLRGIAKSPRGEVVVVCGYNDDRIVALTSAIRAGLVTTLITDDGTLRAVHERLGVSP